MLFPFFNIVTIKKSLAIYAETTNVTVFTIFAKKAISARRTILTKRWILNKIAVFAKKTIFAISTKTEKTMLISVHEI